MQTAIIPPADPSVLRVCSDPNNMPFSNQRLQGFENRIAALVAADIGRTLRYYWMPERRGFIRNTLGAGFCDVVMGLPDHYDRAWTTRPYYRSTYVFVSRRSRRTHPASLDDPLLRRLTIGVQITGNDYENPPAAQALAGRHLVANVRGFTVYGDYSQIDPQRGIVDAVAEGGVDTAIVWGPL
ncbi:MAG TPA: quinoprotein dehydrogenase-associated putative ABC transporter substrate-binding protein, partial [Vicinamibacterales bacterium]|nr:quinoprotein dehydrogenase-associated putative ABC transporter substrate-binding protein [Vicinamibacterales bacterium]